ncbi:S-layer homology domain-containing protein [Paenibacillus methanolicus]|uniref:S-layer family protein n=1 Tax=Paenibacillus methanolicus TaxID=582686 RepID=A0A5S5CB22_9BACL|nr:S-layer homology domain-containing protein [Paenibacillus methanolicus]TYP75702.1 S-layer family protein [Paenibacillus methanolicus]
MIKKLGLWLMLFSLVIQLLPPGSVNDVATAATTNFTFPAESASSSSPRTVTDERITLTGTISNVDASSISYSVYQIVDPTEATDPPNKREGLTSNVYVEGSSIKIYNVQLFPGLNKITFQGTKSGGQVSNSIYIEYRNSPILYNLTATLSGSSFPLTEASSTIVYSNATKGRTTADISITGNAPNASSVSVSVNGNTKSFTVNTANGNTFAASPITLQKGKNIVTFKVNNGTQIITSTRNITFYNGSVTFSDVSLNEVTTPAGTLIQSVDLSDTPTITTDKNNKYTITGKAIIPNNYDTATSTPRPDPTNPVTVAALIAGVLKSSPTPANVVTTTTATAVPTANRDDAYFVFDFTMTVANKVDETNLLTSDLHFNEQFNVQFTASNPMTSQLESSSTYRFKLVSGTDAFIKEVNYLPGYKSGVSMGTITPLALEASKIYGLPLAVEVLVGNYVDSTTVVTPATISNLYGKNHPLVANTDYTQLSLSDSDETVTKDGVIYRRLVFVFSKMPFEGTQTLKINYKNSAASVTTLSTSATFSMLYGPYASYTSIYDAMIINDNTVASELTRIDDIINDAFSNFEGEFSNINDTSEIRYEADTTSSPKKPQTVFFYINNVQIPLKVKEIGIAGPSDNDVRQFVMNPDDTMLTGETDSLGAPISKKLERIAFEALINGENSLRIVFQGTKSYYEKTIKVNIVPNNLPKIPVDDAGVFPFTHTASDTVDVMPVYNDTNFKLANGVYTTKQSYVNLYGTFDFIDLGEKAETLLSDVEDALDDISSPSKYLFKITSTSSKTDIRWNLTFPLQVYKGTQKLGVLNPLDPSGVIPAGYDPDLIVRYDTETQSFSFVLKGKELNADGSASVYLFNVYNDGEYGPKASYRVELDPTALPYSIERPMLPQEAIINKNYLEVIINANGADSVVINKINAKKTGYDTDNDGDIDKPNAFRATISGLKTGVNKISFTITNANDTVSDTFEVTYQPTNIPGAEYLEDMKSSHKVFDGTLSLTFAKGTSLIRTDYDSTNKLKNQIYTGHKLLFGIANPMDGVLNRREYDVWPANFSQLIENYGTRFNVSFPTRFGKASPVYWIDGGLADNLSTASYDPVTTGVDPYQFPSSDIPTYDLRPDDRELVTSKVGKLTLSFDPNIRDSVGTLVTVYHYDVKNKFWVNLGGVVDTGKNTITVPFEQFGYYVVGKLSYSYSDVSNHPYARNYMEAIYSKGLMNSSNYDDFGADMYATRGEFARMIIRMLDIPLNYKGNLHFDDVAPITNIDALWDYRYIETAAREGIIRGTQPRTFEPNNSLTRGEAAVILARALDLKLDTDSVKIDKALQKAFKDYSNISYYSRASVVAIAKKGYIKGSPVDASDLSKGYVFESQSYLLRSDAAIIVGKVMADLKKLPKIN